MARRPWRRGSASMPASHAAALAMGAGARGHHGREWVRRRAAMKSALRTGLGEEATTGLVKELRPAAPSRMVRESGWASTSTTSLPSPFGPRLETPGTAPARMRKRFVRHGGIHFFRSRCSYASRHCPCAVPGTGAGMADQLDQGHTPLNDADVAIEGTCRHG